MLPSNSISAKPEKEGPTLQSQPPSTATELQPLSMKGLLSRQERQSEVCSGEHCCVHSYPSARLSRQWSLAADVDLLWSHSLQPQLPPIPQARKTEEVMRTRLSTSALTDTWQTTWENDRMSSGKVVLSNGIFQRETETRLRCFSLGAVHGKGLHKFLLLNTKAANSGDVVGWWTWQH